MGAAVADSGPSVATLFNASGLSGQYLLGVLSGVVREPGQMHAAKHWKPARAHGSGDRRQIEPDVRYHACHHRWVASLLNFPLVFCKVPWHGVWA